MSGFRSTRDANILQCVTQVIVRRCIGLFLLLSTLALRPQICLFLPLFVSIGQTCGDHFWEFWPSDDDTTFFEVCITRYALLVGLQAELDTSG